MNTIYGKRTNEVEDKTPEQNRILSHSQKAVVNKLLSAIDYGFMSSVGFLVIYNALRLFTDIPHDLCLSATNNCLSLDLISAVVGFVFGATVGYLKAGRNDF